MGAEEKAAFVRAKLVGLRLFGWPVCPGDALEIVPEPENQHDANALQVLVWTGARWELAGYVDRNSAAQLIGERIVSARAVTAGDGVKVPLEIGIAN